MVLSRRWSAFLVLVGVWTWLIWPRFGLAIWRDDRSFAGGSPTSFLWVHALLIGASLLIGTTVGVLGVRAWRATAPARRRAEENVASGPVAPKD
ncbi:SCO4848 family membrane protein [Actinoplanes sp. NPDC049599]|uniref:SCO4848 family membrane protein n=1 Tax=Actinoplanes sp. NPDC049599 TaxID=3363903 RepID=UPI0037A8B9A1